MAKLAWSELTSLQLGRYAEYFVKMEFTMLGAEVYSAEVDDHGIDFVIRMGDDRYYDVQVKSVRALNYIFFHKDKFPLRPNLLAAIVLFEEMSEPSLSLIPAKAWATPNNLLVSHDYEGMESKPEWGLNLSRRNLPMLQKYEFVGVFQSL